MISRIERTFHLSACSQMLPPRLVLWSLCCDEWQCLMCACVARDDLPMSQLKVVVANSLKSLLARLKKQEEEKQKEAPEAETDNR